MPRSTTLTPTRARPQTRRGSSRSPPPTTSSQTCNSSGSTTRQEWPQESPCSKAKHQPTIVARPMGSTITIRHESNVPTPTRLARRRKASAETSLATNSIDTKTQRVGLSSKAADTLRLTRSPTAQLLQAPNPRQRTAEAPMLMRLVGKSQVGACLWSQRMSLQA